MRHSDSLAKIGPALVAAQAAMDNPIAGKTNPHFRSKYVPLNDVIDHIRPHLAKHKLAVVQGVQTDAEGRAGVVTMLLHESGEFIETDPVLLKDRNDNAQGAGSAVTYARRYSLCAALCIAADADDDGNGATAKKPPQDDAAVMGDAMDAEAQKTKATTQKPKDTKPLPGTPEEQAKFQWLCDRIAEAVDVAELDSLKPECEKIADALKGRLRVVFGVQRSRIQKGEKR